jgi:hypothetical protein
VAQLYPQALGSLFIASYDSQGYDGDTETRFYTGVIAPIVFKMTPRQGPRRKHSPSIDVEACLLRRCTAMVAARTA